MSLFTSPRERRLWMWMLAVMAAIYSTLGPARALIDALRERNLLRISFAVVVLVLGATIIWHWMKNRPGWSEAGVALGVALAYWMVFLRMDNPAERTHLIEYGILAALIHQALLERASHGRHVPAPAAFAIAATAVLGLLDETIQAAIPSRVFDWFDVFFNFLAGFMVVAARLALAPVRLPGWRLWFLWLILGAIGWGWSMDAGSFGEPRRLEILGSMTTLVIPRYQGVGAGALVTGVLHWLVLRRYLNRAIVWVPASLGAAALGALVVLGVGQVDADLGAFAGVGLYGTLAGVLQMLVLRQELSGGGWWVLASTVGWIACIPWSAVAGPPGWAVYGATTGTVLVWLLRRRPGPAGPLTRG